MGAFGEIALKAIDLFKLGKAKDIARGNVFNLYECPDCHYRWVWDKRYKYWSTNELAMYMKKD